jgi:hypothetical protein
MTLPFATTGCSDACDDLEELCDSCPGEMRGDCISDKNACDSFSAAGPVGDDYEDECCENEIDVWELSC